MGASSQSTGASDSRAIRRPSSRTWRAARHDLLLLMQPTAAVLVHGLFHQPAYMRALADVLRQRGVTVHVPRLHRGSLAADTAAVQRVVERCEDPPVLLGHSYGGAVIAGVHGVRSFVLLAAFVPDVGESCAQLGGPEAPVNTWVRLEPSGRSIIPLQFAHELFYADCDPGEARRATALLVPQAPGHGRGVVQHAEWKRTASHYFVCTEDRAMDLTLQRRMAARCTSIQEITAGHSLYISQPELVANAVLHGTAD